MGLPTLQRPKVKSVYQTGTSRPHEDTEETKDELHDVVHLTGSVANANVERRPCEGDLDAPTPRELHTARLWTPVRRKISNVNT